MLAQLVTDSSVYKLLLTLHVLTAIVGFGAVFLNGIYGQQAKSRQGAEGLAIMQANVLVSRVAEYFIYAVAIIGVVMVLISPDDRHSWGDLFIWLSLVLYGLGLAISHGVLQPNVRRMVALMTELVAMGPPPAQAPPPGSPPPSPPPQIMEIERRGQVVRLCDIALKIDLVAILLLMVWKPL